MGSGCNESEIRRDFCLPSRCRRAQGRRIVLLEIRQLIVRNGNGQSDVGYTRIQSALTNVDHRVGRSTIRRILKGAGLPPVPQRPTPWQKFLRAHWLAIAGADFLTTEVWTWRGSVTYYSLRHQRGVAARADPRIDAAS